MENVVIVATIKIKEEFVSEVYKELLTLHRLTHEKDAGCLQYDLHQDSKDKNTYVFIETWESQDFLDQHEKKDHFVSFVSKVEKKIEGLDISKLKKIKA